LESMPHTGTLSQKKYFFNNSKGNSPLNKIN